MTSCILYWFGFSVSTALSLFRILTLLLCETREKERESIDRQSDRERKRDGIHLLSFTNIKTVFLLASSNDHPQTIFNRAFWGGNQDGRSLR
ncbi:hypothetical protein BVC80_1651g105 [Macleaya cordata]|uniref:Uncharacterized protein n=1 Tax=Macleaya cordata TaxID=56857 RepID=A0A200PZF7_MACCD|nr:hypothetical protein BVC80_1651g105 [Macleaya cordata]